MKRRKVKPKYFRHEALHTASVCMEMVGEHLQNHHYYDQKINPEFNKQVDLAIDALIRAYQACNKEHETQKSMQSVF